MKNEIQNAYINALLADAVYVSANSAIDAITKGDKDKKPFATLVTKNYEVMAHYKDRDNGKESSFSGTLFKGREGTENAGNYVIC